MSAHSPFPIQVSGHKSLGGRTKGIVPVHPCHAAEESFFLGTWPPLQSMGSRSETGSNQEIEKEIMTFYWGNCPQLPDPPCLPLFSHSLLASLSSIIPIDVNKPSPVTVSPPIISSIHKRQPLRCLCSSPQHISYGFGEYFVLWSLSWNIILWCVFGSQKYIHS